MNCSTSWSPLEYVSEDSDSECTECLRYVETTFTSDWVKFIIYGKKMQENCTKCIDSGCCEKQ